MINGRVLTLYILVASVACGNQDKESEIKSVAPDLVRATGDRSFGMISSIRVAGSNLLATDAFIDPHIIVLDRKSLEPKMRFGRHGQGPKEFIYPLLTGSDPEHPGRTLLYDFENKRLSSIDHLLPRILEEHLIPFSQTIFRPIRLGNGFIANGLFDGYTFLEFDMAGNVRDTILGIPPFSLKELPHPNGRRLANRNFMTIKPDRTRLAVAYQFSNRIDLYDVASQSIRHRYSTVAGPVHTEPRYHVEGDRFFWDIGNEMAYVAIDSTDDYIYILFCGCKLQEHATQEDSFARNFHIFDWSGRLVRELSLDVPITAFDVTDDDAALYAAYLNPQGFPVIGEWRLTETMREEG